MFYSTQAEYAIRGLVYLASVGSDRPLLARDVARKIDMPYHFLAKVLQTLAREGILRSYKGPGGGFALARSASELTLYDIVHALGETRQYEKCAVGFAACSEEQPCALHDIWMNIREQIADYLKRTTLADLAEAIKQKQAVATLGEEQQRGEE